MQHTHHRQGGPGCGIVHKDDLRQVRFLRRQFLQDGELPFTDVLSTDVVSQALTAIGASWNDRIFTPLITLWVFLGQVLIADHSCRAAVARLIAHRVGAGTQTVLLADGRLLPGERASAGTILRRRDPLGGANPGRERRIAMAVEGPPRLSVRRHDGVDARHRGESRGVPSGLQSEAGSGVPRRADRSHHFAVVRREPQARHLPLRRQGPKRVGCCASSGACFAAATSWWRIA